MPCRSRPGKSLRQGIRCMPRMNSYQQPHYAVATLGFFAEEAVAGAALRQVVLSSAGGWWLKSRCVGQVRARRQKQVGAIKPLAFKSPSTAMGGVGRHGSRW